MLALRGLGSVRVGVIFEHCPYVAARSTSFAERCVMGGLTSMMSSSTISEASGSSNWLDLNEAIDKTPLSLYLIATGNTFDFSGRQGPLLMGGLAK